MTLRFGVPRSLYHPRAVRPYNEPNRPSISEGNRARRHEPSHSPGATRPCQGLINAMQWAAGDMRDAFTARSVAAWRGAARRATRALATRTQPNKHRDKPMACGPACSATSWANKALRGPVPL
eukprot:2412450-Alexandrium_andersonii.AAC.1